MAIEVITKEDLQIFKTELLNEIRQLITPLQSRAVKPWLKNSELKELLNISTNTIQRLRIAGKLHPTKMGGTNYYRYEEVVKLMNHDDA